MNFQFSRSYMAFVVLWHLGSLVITLILVLLRGTYKSCCPVVYSLYSRVCLFLACLQLRLGQRAPWTQGILFSSKQIKILSSIVNCACVQCFSITSSQSESFIVDSCRWLIFCHQFELSWVWPKVNIRDPFSLSLFACVVECRSHLQGAFQWYLSVFTRDSELYFS
jgi:hypothetical protein